MSINITNEVPEFILSRNGKTKGEVLGTRRCNMEGCTGQAYIVRWPDKSRSYPCSKGCKRTEEKNTEQII